VPHQLGLTIVWFACLFVLYCIVTQDKVILDSLTTFGDTVLSALWDQLVQK
jgi:hypothetical protein